MSSLASNRKWLDRKPDWHVRLLAKKLGLVADATTEIEFLREMVLNFDNLHLVEISRSEIFTERLLSYWDRKLQGHTSNPTHCAQYINTTCGDKVTMEAVIENGKIADLSFTAHGCCMSESVAAMLVELARGKSIKWVQEVTFETVYDLLGLPMDRKRLECVLTGFHCLKQLIAGRIYEKTEDKTSARA